MKQNNKYECTIDRELTDTDASARGSRVVSTAPPEHFNFKMALRVPF